MAKWILYFAILMGAAYSVPPVRERVDGPVSRAWAELAPHVKTAIDPMRKTLSAREINAIVGSLKEDHAEGRPLPEPARFQGFIRDHLEVGRDPWDNQYFLAIKEEGDIYVGSNGPDGKRDTPDDIVVQVIW